MLFPVLGAGPVFSWPEVSFALLFLSVSLLWILRRMARGAAMPVGDPFLQEALEFRL
jgi:hypothetical protein